MVSDPSGDATFRPSPRPATRGGLSFALLLAVESALLALWVVSTLAAPDGADATRYVDWARALYLGDPYALTSDTFSPTGMPLSQWSHGPGLLATPFFALFGDRALKLLGLVLNLGTACCMLVLLSRASRGDRARTAVFAALALVATHWGFYGLVHSSESLSYFPLAAMLVLASSRAALGPGSAFLLGVLAYLLVLVRAQLAIYCLPVFLWALWPVLHGLARKGERRAGLVCLACACLPPLAALLQSKALYGVMLGPGKPSPYVFGADGFTSFSLAKPELRAVLMHAWHGLLPYHPLYLLVIGCLAMLLVRASGARARVALGALLAVMAGHVLLQGAWYCWWLGTGTFGMRGLSIWFVVGIPALAALAGGRRALPLYVASVAAGLWSYLLLTQTAAGRVYYQYYTLRALFESVLRSAEDKLPAALLLALLAALATGLLLPGMSIRERALWGLASGLFTLYAIYVVDVNTLDGGQHAAFFRARRQQLHGMAALALVVLVWLMARQAAAIHAPAWLAARAATLAVVTAAAIFGLSNAWFAVSLAHIADARGPYDPLHYRYCSSVQVEEILATYDEYLQVPHFKGKKRALKRFVDQIDSLSCPER